MSRRARDAEDEWQQVPEEWLETKSNGKRKARAEDEESELSELTDEDEHDAGVRASAVKTESVEMNGDGKGDNLAMDEDQLTPVSRSSMRTRPAADRHRRRTRRRKRYRSSRVMNRPWISKSLPKPKKLATRLKNRMERKTTPTMSSSL